MKEQLISFETAKLAKEKGFKFRTYWMYDRNEVIQATPSIKRVMAEGKLKELKTPPQIFAPTQSLLQKWLRDKFDLHTLIHRNTLLGWQVKVYDYKEHNRDTLYINDVLSGIMFNSYEKALEKGLQEALKLI